MIKTTLYLELGDIQYYCQCIAEALKKNDYTLAKYYQMRLSDSAMELENSLERIR